MALVPGGTDDRAERKQIELLRAAGPAARSERARRLSTFVIELSRRAIRTRSRRSDRSPIGSISSRFPSRSLAQLGLSDLLGRALAEAGLG